MADPGFAVQLLAGADSALRRGLKGVFDYVLKSLKFGPADANTASLNFGAHYLESTTPSTANTEFAVAHQFGTAPYLLIPVLPVTSSGLQIVPLRTTRPADAQYVYLESSSTGAVVRFYLEGGAG